MEYQIYHRSRYAYNQPVYLRPQILRLRPRSDGGQILREFQVRVFPTPQGQAPVIDLDGNSFERYWFDQPTEALEITVESRVQTHLENPFNLLLDPWALRLPFDYPQSLARQLAPYLQPYGAYPDPAALELAQDIADSADGEPLTFLTRLTQTLYENCAYEVRETGPAWEPGLTWKRRRGSCRDLTVLFMEVCRAANLASRFVSGYEEGDEASGAWELHAWAEVYLPGAGWRGFDPTHGLAVADRHIALAAGARPESCAPIAGQVTPVAPFAQTQTALETRLEAEVRVIPLRRSS
ncbi:MAG: transglutaminase family protein [Cyanobacteria bacterium RI_101]|nr:transglutaminase family protein [Cyanobacteria bacterium RI_101]